MDIGEMAAALEAAGFAVYHMERKGDPSTFVVWQEIGEETLRTGNRTTERAAVVQATLFVQRETAKMRGKLTGVFDALGLPHELVHIDFEHNRALHQYVYEVSVM